MNKLSLKVRACKPDPECHFSLVYFTHIKFKG